MLSLRIGERTVELRVAGIYYEYSSSQGFVLVDRATLLYCLPGRPPSNVRCTSLPSRIPTPCSTRRCDGRRD